jgi:hypothetical protein
MLQLEKSLRKSFQSSPAYGEQCTPGRVQLLGSKGLAYPGGSFPVLNTYYAAATPYGE